MRQIALDTETTGLLYHQGHRIIEIGCIEIIDRQITNKFFHTYINPNRHIDEGAKKITGLTDKFLLDKPPFKKIVTTFFEFIYTADELIIHNANFDINFINNELKLINFKITNIKSKFKIFDTLNYARKIHPRKKNNLNILCDRYNVNATKRIKHGALIDAKLLAEVYIKMTSTQNNIIYENKTKDINPKTIPHLKSGILKANKYELKNHINYILKIKKNI